MAAEALPSPEVLRQLLRYEPETGKLFWLPRTADNCPSPSWFNAKYAGKEALTASHNAGYLHGKISGRACLAHCVIWTIVTGFPATDDIDHEDMDKRNNRWGNLRIATRSQNGHNRGAPKNNTSGFKGVCWHKVARKWMSQITINRKRTILGMFNCKTAAAVAYIKASRSILGDFGR